MNNKKVIYKYPVMVGREFELKMPIFSKILSVQSQNGDPQMWASSDLGVPTEIRKFSLIMTGEEIDSKLFSSLTYVGTFQINDFVGHLFESEEGKMLQGLCTYGV